jgi:hypothetical protein
VAATASGEHSCCCPQSFPFWAPILVQYDPCSVDDLRAVLALVPRNRSAGAGPGRRCDPRRREALGRPGLDAGGGAQGSLV